MSEVRLRFYAELNNLLPAWRRQSSTPYALNGPVSVKHAIEALGVPHTEVALILANGRPVDFSYLLEEDDIVSVYPVFRTLEADALPQLRPPLPSPPRFIVDNHLGRLVRHLRLLGFNALYPDDHDDEALAQTAHEEECVLLTRDRRLLMRKAVIHGYWLRSKEPREQLAAVLSRFQLQEAIDPWRRCLRCNGELRPVAKEIILERLEPKTKKYFDEFHICQDCEQIYWKGSHYEPLKAIVKGAQSGG